MAGTGRLAQILAHKRDEIAVARTVHSEQCLRALCADMPPARDFTGALRDVPSGELALIAECKRRSPSRGLLDPEYDPAARAAAYAAAGAQCLSVLTDARFFGGSPDDLAIARRISGVPVLRKDFIVDAYQVCETRAMGADCLLLIAATLGAAELAELAGLGAELGIAVLVEVHGELECEAALACGTSLLGVNNRNLETFAEDLSITETLVPLLRGAGKVVVAESAVRNSADARRCAAAGANALLVGGALMCAADPLLLARQLRLVGAGEI